MTPCHKTSFKRALKKTLRGLLRVCLCFEEKRMPLLGSWTFFQKESTMQNMKKSKISYLPTIHLSQKSVCKTYIHFLVDIIEVLELSHIFIQADEQVYARITYMIRRHRVIYSKTFPIMGGLHQMRIFSES